MIWLVSFIGLLVILCLVSMVAVYERMLIITMQFDIIRDGLEALLVLHGANRSQFQNSHNASKREETESKS